jgi:hypothetical protein
MSELNTLTLESFLYQHSQEITESMLEFAIDNGYIPIQHLMRMMDDKLISESESVFLMQLFRNRDCVKFRPDTIRTLESIWDSFLFQILLKNAKALTLGETSFAVTVFDSSWFRELSVYGQKFGWLIIPQSKLPDEVHIKTRPISE